MKSKGINPKDDGFKRFDACDVYYKITDSNKVKPGDVFYLDDRFYLLVNPEDAKHVLTFDEEEVVLLNHIWNLSDKFVTGQEVKKAWRKVKIIVHNPKR